MLECLPILQDYYRDLPTLDLKQVALDSWDIIYFVLPYLSQESIVFSRPQLAYLHYLEISTTVVQNYRVFVNLQLTPLKCQKVKKQQEQNRKINHWKSIIDISIWYLIGWVRFKAPGPFGPQKVTANLKPCKNIQSKNKKQNQILYIRDYNGWM